MWPWRKKKDPSRDREAAKKDCASLGNLLLKAGMITPEQLQEALDFQDDNPDRMLGEALVQMGAVEKEIVEALLVAQQAKRAASKKSVAEVVEIAKNRKKPLAAAHDGYVTAAMALKKVEEG